MLCRVGLCHMSKCVFGVSLASVEHEKPLPMSEQLDNGFQTMQVRLMMLLYADLIIAN